MTQGNRSISNILKDKHSYIRHTNSNNPLKNNLMYSDFCMLNTVQSKLNSGSLWILRLMDGSVFNVIFTNIPCFRYVITRRNVAPTKKPSNKRLVKPEANHHPLRRKWCHR